MTRRVAASLVAASLVVSPAPLLAQAAQTSTSVAPVTVTGERKPPIEMIPGYGACLEAVASDPTTAALMSMGQTPRIYVKTRPPRNPDYNAPPRTAPGSALPKVMSMKDYQRYLRRVGLDEWSAGADAGAVFAEDGADAAASGGISSVSFRGQAIAACLGDPGGSRSNPNPFATATGWNGGPSGPVRGTWLGRMEIRLRDKRLPLGFALFEDGRYEEALAQFRSYDHKVTENPEVQLMIGKIYLFALKEKSDPVEGVKWLRRFADRPFNGWTQMPVFDPKQPELTTATGEACMILAHLYAAGHGPIPKDPALTRKYLAKAYEAGHIRAAKMLGDIYYQGIDTPRDPGAAFKAYMDAAKFAYVPAMNAVAQMYADGEVEGGPNPAKAAAWRNEAVKAEDPAAAYALAVAYDRGEGVEADPDRAVALYKLAAMNGEAAAMTALGTYFYRGEAGLPLDLAIARKWFLWAATSGDVDGMVSLAAMMARGEGGEMDRVHAWGWLKFAQGLGHAEAAAAATRLEATFTDADRAGVQALSNGSPPRTARSGGG